VNWASSFQAFKNISWGSFRQDIEDLISQWDEVKVSFPPKEGLERFLLASRQEPFLSEKLKRIDELGSFFERAEKILFLYQYLSDPRLSIPDRTIYRELREERDELLGFFEKTDISIDADSIDRLLMRFQNFRERYINAYIEAHKRERSGEQFVPYERLRYSRRYQLLSKLEQIEMISTQHNRSLVDRLIAGVILSRCEEPSIDSLQSSPICRCGFILGEEKRLTPLNEIKEAIDFGIKEALESLNSSAYQEKIIPYIQGLEEVGEWEKAKAIRSVLSFSQITNENQIEEFDHALTPSTVQAINEAFRGRVVIARRDLDKLYNALIRRKYTLPQVQKIIKEWLKEEEISQGTFIHFIGKGDLEVETSFEKRFMIFLEENYPELLSLLKEVGQSLFKEAMLISLWIKGHGISPDKIYPFFPFLRKGEEGKGELILQELSSLANSLRNKEPLVFEEIVQEVEGKEEFPSRLWSLLGEEKPSFIFLKESIFPSILREAFERLLAIPDNELLSGKLSPKEDTLLHQRTSNFIIKQKEMTEALNDYGEIIKKLKSLKRKESNPPKDFERWESLYIQSISPISFLLSIFPKKVERMGLALPSPARERLLEGEKFLQVFLKSFSVFYREKHSALGSRGI